MLISLSTKGRFRFTFFSAHSNINKGNTELALRHQSIHEERKTGLSECDIFKQSAKILSVKSQKITCKARTRPMVISANLFNIHYRNNIQQCPACWVKSSNENNNNKSVFVWFSIGSFHQSESEKCVKSYRKDSIRLTKDLFVAK